MIKTVVELEEMKEWGTKKAQKGAPLLLKRKICENGRKTDGHNRLM